MLLFSPRPIVFSWSRHANHWKHSVRNMATDSTFTRDGQDYAQVREGLARLLVPVSDDKDAAVFYNPIQQFNRDLTTLVIKAYGEDVVSRPRSANAKHIAKRKRPKSDVDSRDPKKQETELTTTDALPVQEPQQPSTDKEKDTITKDLDMFKDVDTLMDVPDTVNGNPEHTASTLPTESKETKAQKDPQRQGPSFTILDALSATGLRALRYAQELPFVTSVTANDLDASAVEAIRRNAEHNEIHSKINATQGDARVHMYTVLADEETRKGDAEKRGKKPSMASKKYNVIDLDPYGTAAPFLDAAVNAVRGDGGLLCVTCTDSGVFASNAYPEKAFSLYGGIPIKGNYSHEVGLRLVLHSIAASAARYGLAIEPLLSLSVDYYCRVFVTVTKSPAQVKFLAGRTMVVYNCDNGCGAWETQLLARNRKFPNKSGNGFYYKHSAALAPTSESMCKHCESKMHLAGPMYAGPLHNPEFIKKVLQELPNVSDEIYGTKPRIEGMLQTALEEILPPPEDPTPKLKEDQYAALEPYPFYFHPGNLAGALHCVSPDEDSFRGAIRHLGYEVTRSHCKGGSMRTNAPWSVVWHVMREWARQKHPVKVENIRENTAAYRLHRLGAAAHREEDEIDKLEVVFNQKLGRDRSKPGLVRYQTNPKENWGPQSRAKKH
ncbi:N2,N2-dimethylguanosine tRNA methyltransferase [Xylariaceae sp. FL0255]|nr:N2,N2-dimethylguanosine tRNA methyltransferase [Xylariaceae sp. FL0255]